MNILQIVTRRQHRGAELSAWNLSKQLQNLGHNVYWMGLYSSNTDVLALPDSLNIDLPGDKKSFLSVDKVKALKKFLKTHPVDIIQANGSETLKYAVAARSGKSNIPIVYRNISLVSFWMKNSFLKKMFNGYLLSKSDQIVSVGQNSMNDLVSVFPKLKIKTCVISRGVPAQQTDKFNARNKVLSTFGLPENTRILLWVGALSKEKNPLFMVDVMKRVHQQNTQAVLLMAGKGTMETELNQSIRDASLEKVILPLGYRNDLPELNAAADLALLGSNIEGVPGVLLEAFMQGTPCVAVNVGGVSEVVQDGVTGMLIENHDAKTFAHAVDEMLTNNSLRETLGKSALHFVLENYNEEKNTLKFEQLYRKLIDQHD